MFFFFLSLELKCIVGSTSVTRQRQIRVIYVSSLLSLCSIPFRHSPDGTTLAAISVQDGNLRIKRKMNPVSRMAGLVIIPSL